MKRLLFTILLFTAALPAAAQLYHPGEQLFYRVSYKAKMFPNTEVGAVEVKTSEVQLDDRKFYKVEGIGPLVTEMYEFIRDFKGEVPGASPKDCGNYLDMNLSMANYLGKKYLDEVLYGIDDSRLIYPE